MKTVKLNQNEINELLLIDDPFKKRDYIQLKGVKLFVENKGQLLITFATSLGKTVQAIKIIKLLRTKSNDEIHITVPTDTLKKQWELKLVGIENVFVYTIHSYSKLNNPSPLLLVADECHISLSSEESIVYNNINHFTSKYRLYLSATLKKKQKEFIEKNTSIKTEFNVDINEARLLKFIPEYKVYNTYVSFTEKEKEEYVKVLDRESRAKNYFNYLGINKCPDLKRFPLIIDPETKDNITEKARLQTIQWMRAVQKRISLVTGAENKMDVIKELQPIIKGKCIFFSYRKKTADQIGKLDKKIAVYHSSQHPKYGEEQLRKFMENETLQISSVNKLIAGFDDEVTDRIIRHSFNSSELSGIQVIGRCCRINPLNLNKSPIMINLVVEPFQYERKLITPCDNYWLQISLRKIASEFKTLKELKQLEL